MRSKTETVLSYARRAPVIPVVTLEDVAQAVPLARTLVEAGLPVIEVTLRTPRALDAIAAISRGVPEAVVGAGTILRASQILEAEAAGAAFLVTPGTPAPLGEAVAECRLPALPGASSATEVMALAELGFEVMKFFPAEPLGGVAWLKSILGPLGHVRFCPTGGLSAANAPSYLALPNVVCVGGAWMAPTSAINAGEFQEIARLAREAAMLRRPG